jgi:catechol 2,3-dioxygenase
MASAKRCTFATRIRTGIELHWDRPKEQWPRVEDSSGEVLMMTAPLDLDNLLREEQAA